MAAFIVALSLAGSDTCRVAHQVKASSEGAAISVARKWLTESRRSTRALWLHYDTWHVSEVLAKGVIGPEVSGAWSQDDEIREMELQANAKASTRATRKPRAVAATSIEGLGTRTATRRRRRDGTVKATPKPSTPKRQSDYLRNRIEQMKREARAKLATQ